MATTALLSLDVSGDHRSPSSRGLILLCASTGPRPRASSSSPCRQRQPGAMAEAPMRWPPRLRLIGREPPQNGAPPSP